jgi:hypothetical protein
MANERSADHTGMKPCAWRPNEVQVAILIAAVVALLMAWSLKHKTCIADEYGGKVCGGDARTYCEYLDGQLEVTVGDDCWAILQTK